MLNYDEKIEEINKKMKLIEQEYIKTAGKIELLKELKKESEKKDKKEGK